MCGNAVTVPVACAVASSLVCWLQHRRGPGEGGGRGPVACSMACGLPHALKCVVEASPARTATLLLEKEVLLPGGACLGTVGDLVKRAT